MHKSAATPICNCCNGFGRKFSHTSSSSSSDIIFEVDFLGSYPIRRVSQIPSCNVVAEDSSSDLKFTGALKPCLLEGHHFALL